jgi:hypothetical protein
MPVFQTHVVTYAALASCLKAVGPRLLSVTRIPWEGAAVPLAFVVTFQGGEEVEWETPV